MNAETVRLLLGGCLLAMYILAMFSLRRRQLTFGQFFAWGIFALVVPVLGPFLVILNRPGDPPRRPAPGEFRVSLRKAAGRQKKG
jgi:hypothetical protein